MRTLGFFLLILGAVPIASAKIIYVDDDAIAGGDGSSWSSAHKYLQDALDDAKSGDEVWVAEGNYSKQDGFTLKDIKDKLGFHIFGGFKNGATSKFSRNYTSSKTFISGDILGDDADDWSGRSENQMLFDIQGSYYIHFDGIDFVNGLGKYQGLAGERQAAISLDTSSVIFNKCLFHRNGYSSGDPMGVMSASNSSVEFVNCIFVENTGGIFHGKATTTQSGNGNLSVNFKSNVFYENKRSRLGALVWITGVSNTASANARLTYSTIVGDHKFFSSPYADTYGDGNVFYATATSYNSDPNDQGIDSETTPSIYSDFEFVNIETPEGRDGIWGTEDDGLRVKYAVSHKLTSEKHYDSFDLDQDGIRTEPTPFNIYGKSSSLTPIKMLGAYDLANTSSTDVIKHLLTLTASGGGGVIGGGNYEDGYLATIQATASIGYIFQNWNGDYSGSTNPTTLIMDSNKNITASFAKDINDSDDDGLSNYEELVSYSTNPNKKDSDDDGLSDFDEVDRGLNPNSSDKAFIDAVMELKGMKVDNVTPIVSGWYYVPDHGWFWTNKDAYPYTYSASEGDWLYFQSGNESPRFYHYKTKTWKTRE